MSDKTELNDLVSSGVVVFEPEEKDADEDKKQRAEPAQHSYEAASDSIAASTLRKERRQELDEEGTDISFGRFVVCLLRAQMLPLPAASGVGRDGRYWLTLLADTSDPRIESGKLVKFWRAKSANADQGSFAAARSQASLPTAPW